jgi:hypothetical protein
MRSIGTALIPTPRKIINIQYPMKAIKPMRYTANDISTVNTSLPLVQPSTELSKVEVNDWTAVVPSDVVAADISHVTSWNGIFAFARVKKVTNISTPEKSRKKNSIQIACQIRDFSSSPSVS